MQAESVKVKVGEEQLVEEDVEEVDVASSETFSNYRCKTLDFGLEHPGTSNYIYLSFSITLLIMPSGFHQLTLLKY